jgi:hypothetical protein
VISFLFANTDCIGERGAPLNGFSFLIFFLGKTLRNIVVVQILDVQFIAVNNKITTALIGLAESTLSSNVLWHVFLFVCAQLGDTFEQGGGTFEQLFLVIINAIINTNRTKYKEICFI